MNEHEVLYIGRDDTKSFNPTNGMDVEPPDGLQFTRGLVPGQKTGPQAQKFATLPSSVPMESDGSQSQPLVKPPFPTQTPSAPMESDQYQLPAQLEDTKQPMDDGMPWKASKKPFDMGKRGRQETKEAPSFSSEEEKEATRRFHELVMTLRRDAKTMQRETSKAKGVVRALKAHKPPDMEMTGTMTQQFKVASKLAQQLTSEGSADLVNDILFHDYMDALFEFGQITNLQMGWSDREPDLSILTERSQTDEFRRGFSEDSKQKVWEELFQDSAQKAKKTKTRGASTAPQPVRQLTKDEIIESLQNQIRTLNGTIAAKDLELYRARSARPSHSPDELSRWEKLARDRGQTIKGKNQEISDLQTSVDSYKEKWEQEQRNNRTAAESKTALDTTIGTLRQEKKTLTNELNKERQKVANLEPDEDVTFTYKGEELRNPTYKRLATMMNEAIRIMGEERELQQEYKTAKETAERKQGELQTTVQKLQINNQSLKTSETNVIAARDEYKRQFEEEQRTNQELVQKNISLQANVKSLRAQTTEQTESKTADNAEKQAISIALKLRGKGITWQDVRDKALELTNSLSKKDLEVSQARSLVTAMYSSLLYLYNQSKLLDQRDTISPDTKNHQADTMQSRIVVDSMKSKSKEEIAEMFRQASTGYYDTEFANALNTDAEKLKNDTYAYIWSLSNDVSSLRKFEQQAKNASEQLKKTNEELQKVKEEKDTLTSAKDQLEVEKAELEKLKGKLKTEKQNVVTANQQKEAFKSEKEQAESEKAQAEKKLKTQKRVVENMKKQIQEFKGQIATQQTLIDESTTEINTVYDALTEFNNYVRQELKKIETKKKGSGDGDGGGSEDEDGDNEETNLYTRSTKIKKIVKRAFRKYYTHYTKSQKFIVDQHKSILEVKSTLDGTPVPKTQKKAPTMASVETLTSKLQSVATEKAQELEQVKQANQQLETKSASYAESMAKAKTEKKTAEKEKEAAVKARDDANTKMGQLIIDNDFYKGQKETKENEIAELRGQLESAHNTSSSVAGEELERERKKVETVRTQLEKAKAEIKDEQQIKLDLQSRINALIRELKKYAIGSEDEEISDASGQLVISVPQTWTQKEELTRTQNELERTLQGARAIVAEAIEAIQKEYAPLVRQCGAFTEYWSQDVRVETKVESLLTVQFKSIPEVFSEVLRRLIQHSSEPAWGHSTVKRAAEAMVMYTFASVKAYIGFTNYTSWQTYIQKWLSACMDVVTTGNSDVNWNPSGNGAIHKRWGHLDRRNQLYLPGLLWYDQRLQRMLAFCMVVVKRELRFDHQSQAGLLRTGMSTPAPETQLRNLVNIMKTQISTMKTENFSTICRHLTEIGLDVSAQCFATWADRSADAPSTFDQWIDRVREEGFLFYDRGYKTPTDQTVQENEGNLPPWKTSGGLSLAMSSIGIQPDASKLRSQIWNEWKMISDMNAQIKQAANALDPPGDEKELYRLGASLYRLVDIGGRFVKLVNKQTDVPFMASPEMADAFVTAFQTANNRLESHQDMIRPRRLELLVKRGDWSSVNTTEAFQHDVFQFFTERINLGSNAPTQRVQYYSLGGIKLPKDVLYQVENNKMLKGQLTSLPIVPQSVMQILSGIPYTSLVRLDMFIRKQEYFLRRTIRVTGLFQKGNVKSELQFNVGQRINQIVGTQSISNLKIEVLQVGDSGDIINYQNWAGTRMLSWLGGSVVVLFVDASTSPTALHSFLNSSDVKIQLVSGNYYVRICYHEAWEKRFQTSMEQALMSLPDAVKSVLKLVKLEYRNVEGNEQDLTYHLAIEGWFCRVLSLAVNTAGMEISDHNEVLQWVTKMASNPDFNALSALDKTKLISTSFQ